MYGTLHRDRGTCSWLFKVQSPLLNSHIVLLVKQAQLKKLILKLRIFMERDARSDTRRIK